MTRLAACALIALFTAYGISAAQPTNEEIQALGESWLALIDQQKYGESWQNASSAFRTQVSEQKWTEAMKVSRESLGTTSSRKILRVTFAKALPGAPDGDYAVLQFQTSFSRKADSVETLTLALEDGKWKCAGFFIR